MLNLPCRGQQSHRALKTKSFRPEPLRGEWGGSIPKTRGGGGGEEGGGREKGGGGGRGGGGGEALYEGIFLPWVFCKNSLLFGKHPYPFAPTWLRTQDDGLVVTVDTVPVFRAVGRWCCLMGSQFVLGAEGFGVGYE